jgi:transcriptional regulator with XRE-family HTH domain
MMQLMSGRFAFDAFVDALDAVRDSRGMSWRDVAKSTGVSASCLSRLAQGSKPDIDTVAVLSEWARLDPGVFFGASENKDPLSAITAHLSRDPRLSTEAARALTDLMRASYATLASTDSHSDY